MQFSFTLDSLPTSNNSIYTNGRNGRRVMVAAARKYKESVEEKAALELRGYEFDKRTPWNAVLEFHISSSFNKRDVNNMDKLIIDAIALALGIDDIYLRELTVRKFQCQHGDEGVTVYFNVTQQEDLRF